MKAGSGIILIATGIIFLWMAATGKIQAFSDFLSAVFSSDDKPRAGAKPSAMGATNYTSPTGKSFNVSGMSGADISALVNSFTPGTAGFGNGRFANDALGGSVQH